MHGPTVRLNQNHGFNPAGALWETPGQSVRHCGHRRRVRFCMKFCDSRVNYPGKKSIFIKGETDMQETGEKEYLVSVLAKNNPGVLLRIAGLFSRRCYNILSIVAAQTENTEYSRILIVVSGDDRIVRQVEKQLGKLEDIEEVNILDRSHAVIREHLLLKVERTPQNSEKLVEIAAVFHANILSVTPESMILELTGDASTLNSFIELYSHYNIRQILRTGSMALSTD
jgi:acetolactate synthase-1/3 small subunit